MFASSPRPIPILRGSSAPVDFARDLFYRLFILPLKLPPLRERREDIPILARHFLAKYAAEFSLPVKDLSRAAMEKLLIYDWPGNVRELENVLERALVLSDQPVIPADDISLHGALRPGGGSLVQAAQGPRRRGV